MTGRFEYDFYRLTQKDAIRTANFRSSNAKLADGLDKSFKVLILALFAPHSTSPKFLILPS